MEARSLAEMEGPNFDGWEAAGDSREAADFGDYSSNPEHDLDQHDGYRSPRLVPGCSWGPRGEEGRQVFSNSMMQAYVAMRGPVSPFASNHDPLCDWISSSQHRPDIPSPAPENDITKMFHHISTSIDESTLPGDSPRDAMFQVKRPEDFGHLQPSTDMDLSVHELTQCCADFEFESDDDDDEAHAPSGRISPCTFLAWARGSRRWDEGSEWRVCTEGNQRMRPPTPTSPPPFRSPDCLNWYWDSIPQQDEVEGDELTPRYQPPTSPTIVFSPPGVPIHLKHNIWTSNTFYQKFSRMNPMAAREFRNIEYGDPGLGISPASEDEFYTASEVQEAAFSIPKAKVAIPGTHSKKPRSSFAPDSQHSSHSSDGRTKVLISNPAALSKEISAAWQNLKATISQRKALENDAEEVVKPHITKLYHKTDFLSNYLIPRLKFLRSQAEKLRQKMEAKQARKEQEILRLKQLEGEERLRREEEEHAAREKVIAQEMKKAARRERIKAHVATQVRDLVAQQDRETTALNNVSKNRDRLVVWMQGLETRISQACAEVGLGDFESVADEVRRLENDHNNGFGFLASDHTVTNGSFTTISPHWKPKIMDEDEEYGSGYPDTVIYTPHIKDECAETDRILARPSQNGEYDCQGFWTPSQEDRDDHDEYDSQGFWKDPENATTIHDHDNSNDNHFEEHTASDSGDSSQVTVKPNDFSQIKKNQEERRVFRVTIQPTDYHQHLRTQSQKEQDREHRLVICKTKANSKRSTTYSSGSATISTAPRPPPPPSTPQNPLVTITPASIPFFSPQPYYPPPFTRDNINIHHLLHGGPVSESNLPPAPRPAPDDDDDDYDYTVTESETSLLHLPFPLPPLPPPPPPPTGMAVAITLDPETGTPYYCLVPEVFQQQLTPKG